MENSIRFFVECNSVRSGLQIQKLSLASFVPLILFESVLTEEKGDNDTFIYQHYSYQLDKI